MRVFVAVNIPERERERLYAAVAPLRALDLPVRWTPSESLHLTLRFLGSLDERQAEAVREIVSDVAARSTGFDLVLGGLGGFPDLRRPRVWWMGIDPEPVLDETHRLLESVLAGAGFPPEPRPFSPHVTLGRTRDTAGRVPRAVEDVARAVDYRARIPVASIDLMRSHTTVSGARYERLLAAGLGRVPASSERTGR